MEKMNEVFHQSTLDYFKTGEYKISFEEFVELKKENKALLLDLRTKEEAELISFSFALHIPIEELPDRLQELPAPAPFALLWLSPILRLQAMIM